MSVTAKKIILRRASGAEIERIVETVPAAAVRLKIEGRKVTFVPAGPAESLLFLESEVLENANS